jgi:hypothetical protein
MHRVVAQPIIGDLPLSSIGTTVAQQVIASGGRRVKRITIDGKAWRNREQDFFKKINGMVRLTFRGETARSVQLLRASPERHLWADSYQGDLSDTLSLQDRVARSIALEVRVSLTPEEQTRLTK